MKTKAMWPALLAVVASASLAGPALAADVEPSAVIPGPSCSTIVYPGGHELCGEITLDGGGTIHYYFELGTNGADYDTQIPPAPGTGLVITAEEPSVTVHEPLDLRRLAPNTTYFYRLVILDDEGARYSQPVVFATPALQSPQPPTIESTSVSGLTETDGVLEADIDTGGLETNYQFRLFYGCGFGVEACPKYCVSGEACPGPRHEVYYVGTPGGNLPASSDVQHVSLDLNSAGVTLEPYKYRYSVAAINAEGTVEGPDQFFTPPSTLPSDDGLPSIGSQWATNVTETDATLNAYLDPNGQTTAYKLQIDTSGSFNFDRTDSCVLHPPGVVCTYELVNGDLLPPGLVEPPESTLPAGDGPQLVSVNLAAIGATLQPNTKYHFRLIASNGGPEVEGFEQNFTTPSGGVGPPAIVSQAATNVTHDNATLNAVINPNGRETVYKLQIDTTGNFRFYQTDSCPLHAPNTGCATVIVPGDPLPAGLVEPPESSLPAGNEFQHVSVDLASIGAALQPGTTYHYRAIAANNKQLVAGPDQTFTTPSLGSPEPTPPGQPPLGPTAPASLSASSSPPSVSHRRHGKGKRHRHRRHNGPTRSTRDVRR